VNAPHFQICATPGGRWRWKFYDGYGYAIAFGAPKQRQEECRLEIQVLRDLSKMAPILDPPAEHRPPISR
jgi:hypothetical protein